MWYYEAMSSTTITSNVVSQKRTALVDAFLLYQYQRTSKEQKKEYERTTLAQRIGRTMRLEGEPVTDDDVRRYLKLP